MNPIVHGTWSVHMYDVKHTLSCEQSVCRSISRNSSKSTEGINRLPVVTTGSETQTSK